MTDNNSLHPLFKLTNLSRFQQECRTESHRTKSHRQKVMDEKSQFKSCILTKHIGQKVITYNFA